MKFIKTLLLLAALVVMSTTSALAQEGTMVPKIASFDFLVDYSGSMMMTNAAAEMPKIEVAKTVMHRINERIPALDYAGGVHTFAPVSELTPIAPFNRDTLGAGFSDLRNDWEIFNRMTDMGNGMADLAPVIQGMQRNAAVIIVSDGDSNRGQDPVAEARALYAANPDVCFHIISLADTQNGQNVLDQIAAMNACSVMVSADALLNDDAAVDQFVRDVFYDYGEKDTLVLRSVQFALDSAKLTPSSSAILDEVAAMLQSDSNAQIQIDGHTCSLGSDAYNQKLSERRAAAVKTYLASKGVSSSRLTSMGYGESRPKYDNSTDEGRSLNRRAELHFK